MSLTLLALALLLGIWVLPRLWLALIRNKITVDVKFSPTYVTVGEKVEVFCLLRNRSWLPCPFLELGVELPEGLSLMLERDDRYLRYVTFVQAHQELEFHAVCFARKRGYQPLYHHPVVVKMNEGLGLTLLMLSKAQQNSMTVMPERTVENVNWFQLQEISGRIEQFHWLQPDETLIRGIREYHPGDPFKYIAWQASASEGQWMVKQFSASTEAVVCLLLNAQMFQEYWSGTRHEEFDRLCEMVQAYAFELENRGYRLEFCTNAILNSNPTAHFFSNQTARSIGALLGELKPYAALDFMDLWKGYVRTAPAHETFVTFTSYWESSWDLALAEEQRLGRHVERVFGPDLLVEAPAVSEYAWSRQADNFKEKVTG